MAATATVIIAFLVFSSHANWISPEQPLLPKKDSCQAVGQYNGKISIIGGDYNGFHDIMTYNTSRVTFQYQQDGIPYTQSMFGPSISIYGYSQYWTQVDNIMYMVYGSNIFTYDLSNEVFTEQWQDIPVSVSYDGCIASTEDTLFIVGGRTALGPSRDLQIFDMATKTWSVGPKMNAGRGSFSCIVYLDNLYAIGGQTNVYSDNPVKLRKTATIEYIEIDYVQQYVWQFTTDENQLSEPLAGMRSVRAADFAFALDFVYIIGGSNLDGQEVDTVHILGPLNRVIVWHKRLVYGVAFATPIYVFGNTLYVFGGSTADEYATNKWQFYLLPEGRYDDQFQEDGSQKRDIATANGTNNEVKYIGFGAVTVLFAAVLIGVVIWKYVCSRKGFKEYMKETLTKEYGSTVSDEYELAERRL